MINELKGLPRKNINKIVWNRMPRNDLPPTDEGAKKFNEIIEFLKQNNVDFIEDNGEEEFDIRYKINFCIIDKNISRGIFLKISFGRMLYQVRFLTPITTSFNGVQALYKFRKELLKDGIDLDSYKISKEEGLYWKYEKKWPTTVEITRLATKDIVYENTHHIDFHNSYPAGLVNTHPEFRPTVERLYKGRKHNPEYKAILNMSIGCFQSSYVEYAWQHLAYDALWDNRNRIIDLERRLLESGRKPLLINTDGIWYQGDIYHGAGEGPNLGDWENDHVDCILRIKSAGAYEFIEDGQYHPVIRGKTKLDEIKPRTEWQWGDIYGNTAEVFTYNFDPETKTLTKEYKEV